MSQSSTTVLDDPADPSADLVFAVARPSFDAAAGTARFSYRLDGIDFVETLAFPPLPESAAAAGPA